MTNIRMLAAAAALLATLGVAPASAAYPDHPVKVIVPFAAGGPTDVMARLIAQQLSERLKQQFYVENRAGAGGNIGMVEAARATPDGYTMILVSSSFTVNPSLYKHCPYDPFKDLVPVTLAAITPNILIVNPSVPAKTPKELIDLIKKGGKFTDASPGIGTTPHLAAELFKSTYKLDYVIAPYKGGGPAVQAVLSNETPFSFVALTPTTQLVKTGKLRALAVTTAKRSKALPDVPTIAEAGVSGQESETIQGVLMPKGTPQAIVDKLQKEIAAIVATPDIQAKMIPLGFDPTASTAAEFAAYIKTDVAKWKKVIEEAHIKQIE